MKLRNKSPGRSRQMGVIVRYTMISTMCVVLSSCGFMSSNSSNDRYDTSNVRRATLDTSGVTYQDAEALARPPQGNEAMSVTRGSLQASSGLKNTQLFSERLRDEDDRLDRLEEVVQDFRNDFDAVMPAINRLTAIEKDIQQLVGQLKTLLEKPVVPMTDTTPMVEAEERPQPIVEKARPASSSKKQVPISSAGIGNIRISDNGNKTRIVFDSRSNVSYSVNYDDVENLVLVETSAKDVGVNLGALARKSKHVQAVSSTKGENGNVTIIISLKNANDISKGTLIKPNKDSANYRYFFDVF